MQLESAYKRNLIYYFAGCFVALSLIGCMQRKKSEFSIDVPSNWELIERDDHAQIYKSSGDARMILTILAMEEVNGPTNLEKFDREVKEKIQQQDQFQIIDEKFDMIDGYMAKKYLYKDQSQQVMIDYTLIVAPNKIFSIKCTMPDSSSLAEDEILCGKIARSFNYFE